MNGYLSREEVLALGFASVGENVQISNKACFYGAAKMRIGSHVRIDDFCILGIFHWAITSTLPNIALSTPVPVHSS